MHAIPTTADEDSIMFKKLLVGISPTLNNDPVLDEAIAIAKIGGGTVMLLHILSPMDDNYPMPIYPGPDSMYPGLHEEAIRAYSQQWETYQRQGLEYLQRTASSVAETGIGVEFSQHVGDPGKSICELATTWDADLIVIGRRGHTGLKELLMGSVSNYVLHHAPCSVLTVQGETPAA